MSIIEIDNLTYKYNAGMQDEVTALDGISFSVEEGEFVAVIGANGSGKSTLSRLLNGLFIPQSGSVKVYDMLTTDNEKVHEIRKNVGLVFQNPDNQMVATIIEDDIAFGPENLGLSSAEINERVDEALASVGMSGFRKLTPFRLSGGQKQRIAIAGVLAIRPRILILDESTSMLDPVGRKEVLEVVKQLRAKENLTVIMITHFPEEASQASRVIVLDKGKIFADGKPSDVLTDSPKLRSVGLDAPVYARISASLNESGLDIQPNALSISELVEGICKLK